MVEGEATELRYFAEMRAKLRRKTAAVLVWHGDHTDPEGIVREAIKLRDEQAHRSTKTATEPYDQVWVVMDREKQNDPRREQLSRARELAARSHVRVALSIPSFEFWLLLHFHYTTGAFDGCSAVKKELKKFIKNYHKAELPLDDLLARVATAVKHARQWRAHWDSASGDRNPSTDVDELVKALNESARSDVRLC